MVPLISTGPASISGTFFYDSNANGVWNTGEATSPYWLVYLDTNNNGRYESGEVQVRGDANGKFVFSGLSAGTYVVRAMTATGWKQTSQNGGGQVITVAGGQAYTGANIGEVRV
jgi:hypothetical protein